MQSAGLDHGPFPLFQEVGDVFATEGLIGPGVFQGALHFFHAIDFAQGHDLLDVVAGIAPFFLQPLVILLSRGRQRQEAGQELLLPGLPALGQQFFDMLGLFKVLMPVVAADMLGDDAGPDDTTPAGPDKL